MTDITPKPKAVPVRIRSQGAPEPKPQRSPLPEFQLPVVPTWLKKLGSWIFSWAVFPGAIMGGVWYFFGTVHVSATLDDQPIKADVVIDGKIVGKTPYETRLWPGSYSIKVKPPKAALSGLQYGEWELFTIWIGKDFTAEFHTEGAK